MAKTSAIYQKLAQYTQDQRAGFEDKLAALVDIPSISMDPDSGANMQKTASLAAEYLRGIGAEAEIVQTDGFPVVIGELINNQAWPTVTIYNHLDVQPAIAEEWRKAPFTFDRVGDRYEGRGTTDDKGPALTALLAAKYAVDNGVPINIKFIWELEEEIGSPHFEQFVKANKAKLKTDSVLVSDTIWIARGRPAIPYGLRGLQAITMTLETHAKDVHSGLTGGPARNPIGELCDVIAHCYDARTGRVKIPGFYDDVVAPTKAELNSFIKSGFTAARYKKAHELKKLRPNMKSDLDVLKAFMAAPTFEVHGIVGGHHGPGVKTIVPHCAEAKISMRLVPNQDPKKIAQLVRAHVKKLNPDVHITAEHPLKPFLGDFTGPYAQAASNAMKFAFGKEPAFTREGGSIGAVVTMQDYLKAPITFLGLSLPEHGYHAKNENFDWQQTEGGIRMFTKYLEEISALKK
ncbi:MAG: M20/M25/M40 family metallo-hydrolase [Blastocatellia bacterium]